MDQQNQQNSPPPSSKQQITEKLKQANNVLITVSDSPSVDQLAACIGLTLMLNKLDKHATAVFSGKIPSTVEFLKPEETIEPNTDSLRDFIIALDRSKADKLRYKPEDNLVKIFITPYHTALSEKDLQFSQGDFNVDVVVALGVVNKEHLDKAIMAQGRILHDAAILGISCGNTATELGSINWHEPTASSLSEMLTSISESFQSGLLDEQIATAFLTGIVAETARFSNDKTTPKVMTMSAQLMAAGANQQLISTQLSLPAPLPQTEPATVAHEDSQPAESAEAEAPAPVEPENSDPAVLTIEHTEPAAPPSPAYDSVIPDQTQPQDAIHIDDQGNLIPPTTEPVAAATEPAEPTMRHERVIQPLHDIDPSKPLISNYIFDPTAATAAPDPSGLAAQNPSEAIDGLTLNASPSEVPILSHDAPATDDPEASAVSDPAVAEPPTPTLPLPTPEPPMDAPLPPEVTLETSATDNSAQPAAEAAAPVSDAAVIDQDAAREAVLQAMAVPSQPLAALNAQPLNLDAPLAGQSGSDTTQLPPPVPPPMMAPFAGAAQPDDVVLPQPQTSSQPAQQNPFNLPPVV